VPKTYVLESLVVMNQSLVEPKKKNNWAKVAISFFFPICDVAKLVIIHKKI
jgi:hypothetical protein